MKQWSDIEDFPPFLLGALRFTVAVARRAGAMNVIDTINHFFLNKEMYLAGSTYWNIAYGRLPGEAMSDEEGVANMKNLVQNIAWLLNHFLKPINHSHF